VRNEGLCFLFAIFPFSKLVIDLLRRCFVKWLAIARSSRIRIARLEKYRAEMNEIVLIAAWEAWRGRFKEANLIDAVRYQETHMD
jgi:hypothetical protein